MPVAFYLCHKACLKVIEAGVSQKSCLYPFHIQVFREAERTALRSAKAATTCIEV